MESQDGSLDVIIALVPKWIRVVLGAQSRYIAGVYLVYTT